MGRWLKRAGLAAGAVALVAASAGCNGNLDAGDNCSLVIAAAAQEGLLPPADHWFLWDAYSELLHGQNAVIHWCRAWGVTDAIGPVFAVAGIRDGDPVIGGDGGYGLVYGIEYSYNRYPLPGTAIVCQRIRQPLYPEGTKCPY